MKVNVLNVKKIYILLKNYFKLHHPNDNLYQEHKFPVFLKRCFHSSKNCSYIYTVRFIIAALNSPIVCDFSVYTFTVMRPHKKNTQIVRSRKHGHHISSSNRVIISSENNACNTAKENLTVFIVTKIITLSKTNSRE